MSVKDELESIRLAHHKQLLLPEDVVDFARDETTELHAHFEWDDGSAAHNWRIEQARRIIRIQVTVVKDRLVPAYISLTTDRVAAGGYRTMFDVISNGQLKQRMLNDAMRDMETFVKKYHDLEELCSVIEVMTETVSRKESQNEEARI
jgi:hypothetical protein